MRKFITLCLLFALLTMMVGCRGVVGLIDTPEGVANHFLTNLYRLNFEEIPKVAQDQALLQAALMEGMADSFSQQERNRYATSDILITQFTLESEQKAKAGYKITFQDGQSIVNSLYLEHQGAKWLVVRFEQPIVRPQIYTYLET